MIDIRNLPGNDVQSSLIAIKSDLRRIKLDQVRIAKELKNNQALLEVKLNRILKELKDNELFKR